MASFKGLQCWWQLILSLLLLILLCRSATAAFQSDSPGRRRQLRTEQASFVLSKNVTLCLPRRRWGRWGGRQEVTRRRNLNFQYDYDLLTLGGGGPLTTSPSQKPTTRGIVLVHPIGVGIGKWFYDRLMAELFSASAQCSDGTPKQQYLVVVPDLLGCASACEPTIVKSPEDDDDEDHLVLRHMPLLNITDWSGQVCDLMREIENNMTTPSIADWCVVANGGCAPIALHVAAASARGTAPFDRNVTNVVLSSTPRLSFFLDSTADPDKVAQSYRTLCGPIGRLFWWYTCRKKGRFIQKFSEKNLVADPANLGDKWTKNCVETATAAQGKSRYATFAFLAGCLQDGCVESLEAIRDSGISIGIIKGRDVRRNKAKSWFWQRRKKVKSEREKEMPKETFQDYVKKNGNGGREIVVGGRISLAHEDAPGYAAALLVFIG